MTDSCPISYICLATNTAQKLGRNGGGITFKVLADTERQQLFLTITGNDGGGYFSREVVAFDTVEQCLPADRTQPFAAKAFARAFQGKSANQPSFAAALMRSLQLLGPVENKPHLHIVTGDWLAWKVSMLAKNGEVYVPPTKTGVTVAEESATPITAMTREDQPGETDAEEGASRRKGRKDRPGKRVDEVEHANPA